MKQIISILILVVLLSGCAKVSLEVPPCIGSAVPSKPIINSKVIQIGYSAQINPNVSADYIVKWSGPNNFSASTTDGNYLDLFIYTNADHGLYTATSYLKGCHSDVDTFYVY